MYYVKLRRAEIITSNVLFTACRKIARPTPCAREINNNNNRKMVILWYLLFSITQNEPWYIQYGWALFKTLSHMLCIGYGRYIPALLDEALLTIFSMVTGATFYALFIAHSMAFIIRRDSSKTTYQEKVSGIPKELNFYVKARAI